MFYNSLYNSSLWDLKSTIFPAFGVLLSRLWCCGTSFGQVHFIFCLQALNWNGRPNGTNGKCTIPSSLQPPNTNWSSRNETCINFNLYLSCWWPAPFSLPLEAQITPIITLIFTGPRCAIRKLTWLYTTGGFRVSQHNYTIIQPDELWLVAGVWQLSWRATLSVTSRHAR